MRFFICYMFVLNIAFATECEYFFEDKKVEITTNDSFGCEYENRDLQKYVKDGIRLKFMSSPDNLSLHLMYDYQNNLHTFDVFEYSAPEREKIRDIAYIPDKKLIVILHGFNALVEADRGNIEIDAAFYEQSIYRIFNEFLLKIQFHRSQKSNLGGIEGFYQGQYHRYKYKNNNMFTSNASQLDVTNEDILFSLEKFIQLKAAEKSNFYFSMENLVLILAEIPLKNKNIEKYNNIAYYLEQAGAYEEAIYLLEKIIQQFPDRTVAYLNLGDAYWGNQQKDKAIIAYQEYQKQMQKSGKAARIPKIILERLSWYEKHNN